MGRYSLRFLLASFLLGVAAGFGLAFTSLSLTNRFADHSRPVPTAGRLAVTVPAAGVSASTASRATQHSHLTATTASLSLNDLWNRLLASTTEPALDEFIAIQQQLLEQARRDPRVRQGLMRRYELSDERGRTAAVVGCRAARRSETSNNPLRSRRIKSALLGMVANVNESTR